jgi:predicted anti-sigma-YlaC factor YlaD
VQHVTDDLLELYTMQALPQSDMIPMEEHLRICPDCRERLQAKIEFVGAMRGAAVTIRKIEKP